jgi:hypothetical protein
VNIADEVRALVVITLVAFGVNAASLLAMVLEPNSLPQLFAFRVGDTAALVGCVAAGRYVGHRGLHVAAAAFAMLGIVHGISAGASGLTAINVESTANIIVPMIPAFLLMSTCRLFPAWLRWAGVALVIPFSTVYYRVATGLEFFHWTLVVAYSSLGIVEVLWSVALWRDFQAQARATDVDLHVTAAP